VKSTSKPKSPKAKQPGKPKSPKAKQPGKPKRAVGKKKTAVKKTPSRYNKTELKKFEEKLLEEREKVLRQLGVFGQNYANTLKESSGDLSSYSFHMADMGTDAMEREKAFLFASQEGRLLYHIDEALRRLYKVKKYGFCELCSKKIQRKRLEALPHARLCIGCKSKEESGI